MQPEKRSSRVMLSGAELANRLGVCARTVMRWRKTGDGPPYVRCGSRIVNYPLAGVEQWEASRTFAHRAAEISQTLTAKPAA